MKKVIKILLLIFILSITFSTTTYAKGTSSTSHSTSKSVSTGSKIVQAKVFQVTKAAQVNIQAK